MFSFMIMLSTLVVLFPYIISSLAEITIYLRKKALFKRKQLTISISIAIPAFLYSVWAVIGLGYEIIMWGLLLLVFGIPIFVIMKFKDR